MFIANISNSQTPTGNFFLRIFFFFFFFLFFFFYLFFFLFFFFFFFFFIFFFFFFFYNNYIEVTILVYVVFLYNYVYINSSLYIFEVDNGSVLQTLSPSPLDIRSYKIESFFKCSSSFLCTLHDDYTTGFSK